MNVLSGSARRCARQLSVSARNDADFRQFPSKVADENIEYNPFAIVNPSEVDQFVPVTVATADFSMEDDHDVAL
ncbi:hypothetical protein HK104_004073 [Borealophlyctis nickersoniae]|nr:hypothetical protein HK104_004073 [Borealophlyctis nickersoniae]